MVRNPRIYPEKKNHYLSGSPSCEEGEVLPVRCEGRHQVRRRKGLSTHCTRPVSSWHGGSSAPSWVLSHAVPTHHRDHLNVLKRVLGRPDSARIQLPLSRLRVPRSTAGSWNPPDTPTARSFGRLWGMAACFQTAVWECQTW